MADVDSSSLAPNILIDADAGDDADQIVEVIMDAEGRIPEILYLPVEKLILRISEDTTQMVVGNMIKEHIKSKFNMVRKDETLEERVIDALDAIEKMIDSDIEDQNIVIRADDVELDLFDEDEVLLDRVNENCKRGDKYVVRLVRKDMNPDLEFILGLDVAENSTAKAAKGVLKRESPDELKGKIFNQLVKAGKEVQKKVTSSSKKEGSS